MSVLQRKELEQSPLADLHAIASELGIERLPRAPAGRPGQRHRGRPGRRGRGSPRGADRGRRAASGRSRIPDRSRPTRRQPRARAGACRASPSPRLSPWRACSTCCRAAAASCAWSRRRRVRVACSDPPLRAARRGRGGRPAAARAPQRAAPLARARGEGQRPRRRAARGAPAVLRPDAGAPDRAAARAADAAQGRALRQGLARGRVRRPRRRRSPAAGRDHRGSVVQGRGPERRAWCSWAPARRSCTGWQRAEVPVSGGGFDQSQRRPGAGGGAGRGARQAGGGARGGRRGGRRLAGSVAARRRAAGSSARPARPTREDRSP